MSPTLTLLLAVLALALVVAAVTLRRRLVLPKHPWADQAGAIFAGDAQERQIVYHRAAREHSALRTRATAARAGLCTFNDGPAAGLGKEAICALDALPLEVGAVLEARERGLQRLTVVLFGRTKAGKSSLFAALTGRGFEGIGDGRQNVTRDNRREVLRGVEVIDTPGISGVGSSGLEDQTLDAVREADVVVVHITDDRLSREDLERIDALAWPARPVIFAVNVKAGDLERVMHRPDKVFRDADLDAHVNRLREGLPSFANRRLPVVRYHALSAVEAKRWRPRWRWDRRVLWQASRIGHLLDQLVDVGAEATAAARLVPLAIVEEASERLEAVLAQAAEQARAAREGEERGLAQVRGVIEESRGRRALARAAIDEHFSETELALIGALAETDAGAYRDRVEHALGREGLGRQLEELLDAARSEVVEKFEELVEELDVMGVDLGGDTAGVEAVWSHIQEHWQKTEKAKSKRRTRGVLRAVLRGAVVVAGAAAGALAGPGAVAGGGAANLAADRLLDAVLPEIVVPAQDRETQLRRIREIVKGLRRDALRAFDGTLEKGLLGPLEQRLVAPRLTAIQSLTAFVDVADHHRQVLREPLDSPKPIDREMS